MIKRISLALLGVAIVLEFLFYRVSQPETGLGDGPMPTRLSPAEAIAILRTGNTRYVLGARTFARLNKARIAQTELTQEPFATFLSCSDSRVPVELRRPRIGGHRREIVLRRLTLQLDRLFSFQGIAEQG